MKKVMALILLSAAMIVPNAAYGFFGRGNCCNTCNMCEMSMTDDCGCDTMNNCCC